MTREKLTKEMLLHLHIGEKLFNKNRKVEKKLHGYALYESGVFIRMDTIDSVVIWLTKEKELWRNFMY